jgi:hypothetical protein
MERHWDAASQGENAAPASDGSVVSRQSFCDYLVGARKQRGMSINDIATVTRIPVRSLERLESGLFEELPADVFVRGFLRSYSRCVGLNAEETIRRYTHCGMTPAPVSSPMAGELSSELASVSVAMGDGEHVDIHQEASPSRRSSQSEDEQLAKETRAEQAAPIAHESVARIERRTEQTTEHRPDGPDGIDAIAASVVSDRQQPRRKRKRRKRKQRRDSVEASAPQSARHFTSQAEAEAEPESRQAPAESSVKVVLAADSVPGSSGDVERTVERAASPSAAVAASDGAAQPLAARVHARSLTAPPLPARRVRASTVTTRPVPVLVIDDEHPEDAERSQEERVERSDASWRSFLPPALLDSDDGSHRGTLTLAVIILVIVATLTMSYLLRRPNVSGDGVTWQETSSPRARA